MNEDRGASGVGLVFVSHSQKVAEGLVELATQMAPHVTMVATGGTDDGGIGTSFTKVSAGMSEADTGAGAVVLCDLGSAILTAETALEFLDDVVRDRILVVDAPLVEGAVAAAVAAETGGSLVDVADAARSAYQGGFTAEQPAGPVENGAKNAAETEPLGHPDALVARTVVLPNKDGLHARPAAEFVKLAKTFDSHVTVNGRDAKSLLGIMGLGLTQGATVEIASTGSEAEAAVSALAKLIESGFGEA
ncbi:MAG TPA: dihydroxyacetone kinase phosphoryl donor subunit DhaM [Glaciibacter sp.]|nr:dihydroxyacetone kinase phosphoryl donor subunit DhaM [Glaciibacter sp.]